MTEEMLRTAAKDSSRAFVEALEADFDPRAAYSPSVVFRRKLRSLRRRAEHPYVHTALRRVAMFLLACLVSGGVFLSVDAEARDALRAWLREIGENHLFLHPRETVQPTGWRMGWVPEGLQSAGEFEDGPGCYEADYIGPMGLLRFAYVPAAEAEPADEAAEAVTVGDQSGSLWTEADGGLCLRWQEESGTAVLTLRGRYPRETLLLAAENVYALYPPREAGEDTPAWRPEILPEGLALDRLDQSGGSDFPFQWEFRGEDGRKLTFYCARPGGGRIGTELSEEALRQPRTVTVRGNAGELYEDGGTSLLTWEDGDGTLFWLRGEGLRQEELLAAGESMALTQSGGSWRLASAPEGFTAFQRSAVGDTAEELWVQDGVAVTFLASRLPLALPEGPGEALTLPDGTPATFWPAEEAYRDSGRTVTVNGQPVESGGGISIGGGSVSVGGGDISIGGVTIGGFTVPALRESSTLFWQDPETGSYLRLQGIPEREVLLALAEGARWEEN